MAIDLTIMAADQAAVIADLPDTVTIAGVAYTVSASAVQTGQTLDIGGMMTEVTFQFSGLTSDLSGIVAMNKRVTYKSIVYRIARIFPDSTGASITCYCVDDIK